jgi:predicted ferric reductase
LLGYIALFLSILSSAYMKQLFRLFGRPFIQVHHILSVSGLIMIALHPISLAIDAADAGVFVPKFDSLDIFLTLGGRPALYLVGVAALAAVGRKTLGQNWRIIHFLNYVAFWLITVHAIRIGRDFQNDVVQGVSILMALAVLATFVQKRVAQRRRARR